MLTPTTHRFLCFTPTTRNCSNCSTILYCSPEHAALLRSSSRLLKLKLARGSLLQFAPSHDKICGKEVDFYDEPELTDADIDGLVRLGGRSESSGLAARRAAEGADTSPYQSRPADSSRAHFPYCCKLSDRLDARTKPLPFLPLSPLVRSLTSLCLSSHYQDFWTTFRCPSSSTESLTLPARMARTHLTQLSFYSEGPSTGVDPFRSLFRHKITAFDYPRTHPPSEETKDRQNLFLTRRSSSTRSVIPRGTWPSRKDRRRSRGGCVPSAQDAQARCTGAPEDCRGGGARGGGEEDDGKSVEGLEEMVRDIARDVMAAATAAGRG